MAYQTQVNNNIIQYFGVSIIITSTKERKKYMTSNIPKMRNYTFYFLSFIIVIMYGMYIL